MDLRNTFDRVVVINLRRRRDRLEQFQAELKKCNWPFKEPIVVPAVDGRAVPVPGHFKGGQGAHGCLKSHSRACEDALADGVKNLLIMEDDIFFPSPSTFVRDMENFLAAVPQHDGLMLGGQHISGGPKYVKPGVVRCMNTQRTHAYSMKGRWMKDLYQAWQSWHTHIDHKMGGMMQGYNIYAPETFLIGQSESRSDITCRDEKRRLWSKPPAGLPCVLLRTPREVRDALVSRLHFGYTLKDGLDTGLIDAFRQHDPRGRLSSWCDLVGGEAWATGKTLAVYHPQATVEVLREVWRGPVVEVDAETVEQALEQLPEQQAQVEEPPILLLRAGKDVVEELRVKHNCHFGFWRSPGSEIDVGLLDAMTHSDPLPALRAWVEVVGGEARARGAILALRHPGLTLAQAQAAALPRKVIEVEAKNAREALARFKEEGGGQ